MRTELPVCKRCCFCIPLRYGLITWGYLKLATAAIISVALTVTLISLIVEVARFNHPYDIHRLVVVSIVLVVMLIDVALNTVFVVGGHMKNVKLLRVYYIYNIVLWALTIALVLVMGFFTASERRFSYRASWLLLVDFASSFVNIIVEAYFILLLRSEIIKLRNNCEFRFVNNAAEAECTMQHKEGIVNKGKGMEDVCEKGTCERENLCAKTCQINGTCQKNEDLN